MRSVLAYCDRGRGPALVLLHGIGSDHRRWDPLVARLEDSFRCLSVDLPGHGGSGADAGLDVLSASHGVQEVLERAGAGSATVVGHSLGATVALVHGALHAPRSVVAVDPAPLHLPHLAASLQPYAARLLGDDFAAAFDEWERRSRPDLVPVGLSFAPRRDTVLGYWRALLEDPASAAERQPAYAAALHAIAVPTLVLLADAPTAEDQQVLAGMRTAVVEVAAGQGHFLHLADPDGFCARLRRWHDGLAVR